MDIAVHFGRTLSPVNRPSPGSAVHLPFNLVATRRKDRFYPYGRFLRVLAGSVEKAGDGCVGAEVVVDVDGFLGFCDVEGDAGGFEEFEGFSGDFEAAIVTDGEHDYRSAV